MTAQLAPAPVFRAWNNIGFPLVGGKLFTYVAGTTTKQATYVDSTQTTQNMNPVTLNFRGEANVWLDPTKVYKLVLAPATDSDPPSNPFWSVDNISGGAASPSFNIIPTVDNLFTLGNTSFSWANVYVGPNHAPILGASGIVGYYPRTAAEIALSVTPTDFSYPADPYVDPRRYGAVSGAEATTAVQTALNVAYQARSVLDLGANNFLIGGGGVGLTLTVGGGDTDLSAGLHIRGSDTNSAFLTRNGSISAVLTLSAAAPTGAPQNIPMLLENFTINSGQVQGTSQTCDGLQILNLAGWTLRKMQIFQGNRCAFLNSALTGLIQDCQFSRSQYGVRCRTNGAGAPPNLIRIENSIIDGNAFYAVDYDTGSELQISGCDIESNGTDATFTANPGLNANAGTLTAVWSLPTGAYACFFPDGTAKTMNFTNGSTAVTWAGGNPAQTAAWIGTPTGAIHIGGAINAAPAFGFGKVSIKNCWIEDSRGGYAIQMDAPTAGQQTWLSIEGGHCVSSHHGLAMQVVSATHLAIKHFYAAGATDNCVLSYTYGSFEEFSSGILTDTPTYPTYTDVTTSAGHFPNGRVDNFTATLTGCTTSPTGNVVIHQQGDEIILDLLGQIVATSNTTAATLTGLPSKYWPQSDTVGSMMIQDNSTNSIRPVLVAAATGVITLGYGQTLTNAGSKGAVGGQVRWRRP